MKNKLPLKSLKKKLWKLRSEYIRKRDTDWKDEGNCFSCNKQLTYNTAHAGHYYSRIYDFTTELLTSEENVNIQCPGCNTYRGGSPQEYAIHLQAKYGENILVDLQAKKNTPKHWKYSEIERLIEVYQDKINE